MGILSFFGCDASDDGLSEPIGRFEFVEQNIFEAAGVGMQLAGRDLFVGCAMKAKLTHANASALVANRRAKDSAGHGPEFVDFAKSRFGIERRANFVIGKCLKSFFTFKTLIENAVVNIPREVVSNTA